ncbi:NAD(P)-binding protein [Colletotrichum zoysiae]|uniref:NAD(P)-binding protein n=1 Tax=Colletotrichum zoysiae TaxID=1216348 RepID=A0AAD9H9M6_9PEZI|nr:NAD(P)-binding protein [Colletotrichum zoysiae]
MSSVSTAKKVWLITGASSGLGLEMALSALRAGHRVIGTGRNISKAASDHPQFSKLGGQWLQLDVAHPTAQDTLAKIVVDEEKLVNETPLHWVIVNNAGNTLLGAVEDMSEEQISSYLQTNMFGTIRVWKAMLPALRRQRQGTLITISSIWGFVPKCEHMMYSAVKATTESLSESYASLLAPFGVRTLIVEPGGFRTSFASNSSKADGGVTEDYQKRISAWIDIVDGAGNDPNMVNGDPELFGQRILEAVEGSEAFQEVWAQHNIEKPLRLQLGSDCYAIFGEKLKDILSDYERVAAIAKSTDVRN